ncbi:SRPBCC family protein [Gloeocapsopsis dulcis]|uniref:Cyclase n=1 Tax=Gloeocapsopsis dulcis AAB1 = 1H9 TaxID=1433147 RepID=A0A6N8FVT5_9CHRO|nr:SRPBCC family protein [Gloeocapsopsis dulcis]MUL37051.1 cyclase [Gloeocapsopsis dulcis AAB1 = 1H9]WNN87905.1 SRPBCC family protein [Gloeocapsopsis dulcis]
MNTFSIANLVEPAKTWSQVQQTALLQGEILVETRSHSAWGGAVMAAMYLPVRRSQVWQQITDYPRWVQYFPDVIKSEVLQRGETKRLYQVAKKAFFLFTTQVEVYLNVIEVLQQRIQFRLEQGTFNDFTAELKLQDCGIGTVLTYAVQATPNIPVPTMFIQQAMHLELPENMRQMRRIICSR